MNKKVSLLIAISILVTTVFSIPTFAATANPAASTVLVNGSNVAFDAYNIADNNYFKLRDLAFTPSASGTIEFRGADDVRISFRTTGQGIYHSADYKRVSE